MASLYFLSPPPISPNPRTPRNPNPNPLLPLFSPLQNPNPNPSPWLHPVSAKGGKSDSEPSKPLTSRFSRKSPKPKPNPNPNPNSPSSSAPSDVPMETQDPEPGAASEPSGAEEGAAAGITDAAAAAANAAAAEMEVAAPRQPKPSGAVEGPPAGTTDAGNEAAAAAAANVAAPEMVAEAAETTDEAAEAEVEAAVAAVTYQPEASRAEEGEATRTTAEAEAAEHQPELPMDGEESGGGVGKESSSSEPANADDWVGKLKRVLADRVYGTNYGVKMSADVRGEIFELVSKLEAENPTPAPLEAASMLDGNWILLYMTFSELLPLLAVSSIQLVKIRISQAIDTNTMTMVNATTISNPFARFSFSATASIEALSPSRVQVRIKEGDFQPPQILSTVDLPEAVDIFGQKINLAPVQQLLNPLQEAAANIMRSISGLPPLKIPIPGNILQSWLLTTYLDEDFRISRVDGGLFLFAKEGSPLLKPVSKA